LPALIKKEIGHVRFTFGHRIIRIIALLLLGAAIASPLGAEEDIAPLEARITRLEAAQEDLLNRRAELILQSDRLAGRIADLKAKARTKEVKAELRASQDLTRQIEELDRALAALNADLLGERADLKTVYEERITALIHRLTQASNSTREALLQELIRYRTASRALDVQEEREKRTREEGEIEIEPHDGPDEIREKADLLADVADRMAAELTRLSARIEDLNREKRIHRKMQELADEIVFFDEDLGAPRTAQRLNPAMPGGTLSRAHEDTEGEEKALDSMAPPSEEGWDGATYGATFEPTASGETAYRTEPETFSPEDLERQIERLIHRRAELSEKADALRDKAERFYRKATEAMEAPTDAPSR